MPFSNEAVGGQTLVRAQIKSPNYVAGVSGWAIKRDGSAEFNNVVSRGSVEVDGTAPSKVKIYQKAGVPLIEFTSSNGDISEIAAYVFGGLALHAGEELTFVSELVFEQGGLVRIDSADSIGPSNGIIFDHLSGYFKSRMGLVAESFHAAALVNFWTNYGNGYAPLQYRLLPTGMVHIEGTIVPGTTADGTTVTTLPVGYRPLYVIRRIPITEKGFAMMADILTNGDVKVIGTAGATTVSFCAQFPVIDV